MNVVDKVVYHWIFQCIYAVVILLPFCVYTVLYLLDYQALLDFLIVITYNSNGVIVSQSPSPNFLPQWISFGFNSAYSGPDTVFYALNILLVVRVYSKVMWQIPVGIYRLIRKLKKTTTTNVITVMPMNSTNNQQQQSHPKQC